MMVEKNEELAPANLDYIKAHTNHLELQTNIINKLKKDTQNSNYNTVFDMIEDIKNNSNYSVIEKDFIIGFTNGQVDYITLDKLDRDLLRFFCMLP